tara:strand:+ start:7177 stop:7302 length:126 start_codon:yes stop_codon:yes gene_type:complete
MEGNHKIKTTKKSLANGKIDSHKIPIKTPNRRLIAFFINGS